MSDDEPAQPALRSGGAWVAVLTTAGVAAFSALSLVGLGVHGVRQVVVWLDLVLFGLGCLAFLVSFFVAGSRALEGVAVRATGLYLGAFAASRERAMFRWSFVASIAVALVVALVAGDPDPLLVGFPWSAWGILVPLFPPGMAGLHGAVYCPWPTRSPTRSQDGARDDSVSPTKGRNGGRAQRHRD